MQKINSLINLHKMEMIAHAEGIRMEVKSVYDEMIKVQEELNKNKAPSER